MSHAFIVFGTTTLGINKIQASKVLQHPIAKSNIISRHTTKQLDLFPFQLCRFFPLSLRPTLPSRVRVRRALCPFQGWVQVDNETAGGGWRDAITLEVWRVSITADARDEDRRSIKQGTGDERVVVA